LETSAANLSVPTAVKFQLLWQDLAVGQDLLKKIAFHFTACSGFICLNVNQTLNHNAVFGSIGMFGAKKALNHCSKNPELEQIMEQA
jgi:hypothetical protein